MSGAARLSSCALQRSVAWRAAIRRATHGTFSLRTFARVVPRRTLLNF
jgi:hypothetical protein